MAKPQMDKEPVAELIDQWLQRSGLRQLTVAQRIGLSPDEFYQGYKNTSRPVKTDPDLAIKLVQIFAEQPAPARARAAEALRFLVRIHLPLDRFSEVQRLFPPPEWQQAVEDLFPDQQWVHRLTSPVAERSRGQTEATRRQAQPDVPYLLISLSSDPDNTWSRIALTEPVTVLGRLEAHEAGPGYIHLNQPHVSYQHAQIVREQQGYLLRNWHAKYGIGLYERSLHQGETHHLRHGDIFRIPHHEEHYRIMFLLSDKHTLVLPFYIDHSTQHVRIFEQILAITPLAYDLIVYLYRQRGSVCSYEELIEHLWSSDSMTDSERRRNLEAVLAQIRRQIIDASGGFSFMQTIGKIGVSLVV